MQNSLEDFRLKWPQYSDMSDQDLTAALLRKFGTVNHEDLAGPGVVNAATSHNLQQIAPDVKPVVKGTKSEVLQMKKDGQIKPGMVVFTLPQDVAYIIDPNAVQAIFGGSKQQAVQRARLALQKGGDAESILLGYPKREGLQPEDMETAAVTKDGEVVTDLAEMKDHADNGNVAWAAEGLPDDVASHAEEVAQALTDNSAGEDIP